LGIAAAMPYPFKRSGAAKTPASDCYNSVTKGGKVILSAGYVSIPSQLSVDFH